METTEQQDRTHAPQHYWAFQWLDSTGLGSIWIGLSYLVIIIGYFHLLKSSMGGSNQFRPEIKWILSTYGVGFLTLWLVLAAIVETFVDTALQ